ncbi:MAG: DUF368 domain-containing protein, partial [Betaproteobacteria bacterium]|nr:DUF368 domain-containing protein [Betaproteobacteria bacterium]
MYNAGVIRAAIINFAKARAGIFARGVCMGAADLVPGVSGGTVAFITGIYGRLLVAVGAFSSPPLFADVLRLDFASAWRRCDGGFLLALAAGILSAVALLGNLLHKLLDEHAHLLLAFFCGLVAASAAAAARRLQNPSPRHIAAAFCGAALALAAVLAPPVVVEPSPPVIFLGGAVAICAMLLPGISGSYILLILGLYAHILDAVRNLQFLTLFIFAAGCAAGMLAFARLLSFMLRRWHDGMISFLTGVMLGALPKLWPWKEKAEGAKIILQPNVWPDGFLGDPQIFAA